MNSAASWDEGDLAALLTLEPAGPDVWRSRYGDANLQGRAYGGQSLGQAMAAAVQGEGADRPPTMMQCLFLQGVDPSQPVDYRVTTLQVGKRFTSKHVRATQARDRTVLDAQVSFAVQTEGPSHAQASTAEEADPATLPSLEDLGELGLGLRRLGGYAPRTKAGIEFRVPAPDSQLHPAQAQARLRYWMRARRPLPAAPGLHAAVYAYLSDWWLNFASLGLHQQDLPPGRRLYIASLNHALWLHRPFAADQWLHVLTQSPVAQGGRGLSIAQVHDQSGQLVASATQECLMALAD